MAQSETGVKAIELLGEQFEKDEKLQDEAYSTAVDLKNARAPSMIFRRQSTVLQSRRPYWH